MEQDTSRFESTDGTSLLLYRWAGDPAPLFAVHVAHGMGEHAARYARLAAALVEAGGVVYAHDHRGHGRSVRSPAELGVFGPDGWNRLVADLSGVHAFARAQHPGIPFAAIGHSMGSFALQQLMLDESHLLDAAALSGSAAADKLVGALVSPEPVSFSALNAAFEPARTEADWLSRDPAEVDAYVADPLCGFGVCAEAARDLAAAAARLADPAALRGVRSDLPVYVVAGEADPVNGGLLLLDLLVQRYREAGLSRLEVRTYPGARHEVLNETNRDEVTRDLLDWLRRSLGTGRD
jgi:alpha-beta hydrolase superfamily lysophospholipase